MRPCVSEAHAYAIDIFGTQEPPAQSKCTVVLLFQLKRGGHKKTATSVKNWKIRHCIVTPGRMDYYAPNLLYGTGLKWKGAVELLNVTIGLPEVEEPNVVKVKESGNSVTYNRFHVQTVCYRWYTNVLGHVCQQNFPRI